MACPTCDHTMQKIAEAVWHCPRCGTIADPHGRAVPQLVERVVQFCGTLTDDDARIIANMERLGVTEAATHPDVRC